MAAAVANRIPVLNLEKISSSVYNSRKKISLTNQTILTRTKSIQENTSVQKRLISENQTYIKRREEQDERNKQEDILEASDIIKNQPNRISELTKSSNLGIFGRLVAFAGHLAVGWILTRLPQLIKIGEEFLGRLKVARDTIGNFFNRTLLFFQGFGKILSGIFSTIVLLDFDGLYNRIGTDFDTLITDIGKMGTALQESFSFIIDPLRSETEKQKLQQSQIQDTYTDDDTTSSSPSGPSGTIVSATGIPPEGKALLDAIAGSEAGPEGYKSRFPSKSFSSFADHPRKDEPIPWRPGWTSNAAGRYQFISTTWDDLAGRLRLKDFSPANQDRAAWQLAIDNYGKGESGIIEDLRKNPLTVANKLSPTWTSLPGGAEQNAATSGFVNRFQSSVKKYSDATSNGSAGVSSVNFESQTSSANVVAANSPDTGSGYTVKGVKDAQGRPVVFSRAAAEAFYKMMKDSGGVVKGSDIASSQRSSQKNSAVGGVSGSKHLSGTAMDIHGQSNSWIRKNGSKYGWFANDYDGSHGGHFEFRSAQIEEQQKPTQKPAPAITSPPPSQQQNVYETITPERKGEQYLVLDQRNPQQSMMQTLQYSSGGGFVGGDDLVSAFNSNIKKRLLNDLSYV
jgi:muramidase (phage lysozyme)